MKRCYKLFQALSHFLSDEVSVVSDAILLVGILLRCVVIGAVFVLMRSFILFMLKQVDMSIESIIHKNLCTVNTDNVLFAYDWI